MMTELSEKRMSPAEAVRLVRDGDWVVYGFGAGFPELLDKALAARKGELKDVKIRGGLLLAPRIEAVECDPEQESFHYYSVHIGETERKLQRVVLAIQDKFGKNAVLKGMNLEEGGTTIDRNHQIGGHKA